MLGFVGTDLASLAASGLGERGEEGEGGGRVISRAFSFLFFFNHEIF